MQALLDVINSGQHSFSVEVQHDGSGARGCRWGAVWEPREAWACQPGSLPVGSGGRTISRTISTRWLRGTSDLPADPGPHFPGTFDGQVPPLYQSPWMRGMYLGQLDSRKEGGIYPGWSPNRDPTSKWCAHPPCLVWNGAAFLQPEEGLPACLFLELACLPACLPAAY